MAERVNIVIPLGGIGRRFSDEGYIQPKPLIRTLGKPILFWTLDNLKLGPEDTLTIPYHHSLERFNFGDIMRRSYPHAKLVRIPRDTKGAAETVLFALDEIGDLELSSKTICLDGDTFYDCDIIARAKEFPGGGVFSFISESDKAIYSYVEVDGDEKITRIKEKVKISNRANSGCYVFPDGIMLRKYAKKSIEDFREGKGELFLSYLISQMIDDNISFHNSIIEKDLIHVLGTPYQVRLFASENVQRAQKRRFCFDLDNTLVTYPTIDGDYSTCLPIEATIELVQGLKTMGHTIIIHTARRMRTHSGNVGSVIADIGDVTISTLEKFSIPYDELVFGKPYADFYVDDLGISTASNIAQEIGFHHNDVKERDFNQIKSASLDVIVKKSEDMSILEGEIFWYENMPNEISALFPKFIGRDGDDGYIIEKIRGIPASKLYSEELLSKENLSEIIKSLELIHSSETDHDEIEVDHDANYVPKVEMRYEKYDYAQFPDSEKVYGEIISQLNEYCESGISKNCVIHGDPVFSNILLKDDGSVKFIDMRGEIGGVLSLRGDKWYDFAKLFQSLDGYDEILNGSSVNREYKEELVTMFKEYIEENYSSEIFSWIKVIKDSLIFSLLPLHPKSKSKYYYKLIS